MQSLVRLCVRRPVFAAVLVLTIVVVGLAGYFQLGLDQFPKIDSPSVTITTRLAGASPEEIETDITQKIEEAVSSISGLDSLESTSSDGVSSVRAQFVLEKNGDVAAQEVRDHVDRVLSELPDAAKKPEIAEDGSRRAGHPLRRAPHRSADRRGDRGRRQEGEAAPPGRRAASAA